MLVARGTLEQGKQKSEWRPIEKITVTEAGLHTIRETHSAKLADTGFGDPQEKIKFNENTHFSSQFCGLPQLILQKTPNKYSRLTFLPQVILLFFDSQQFLTSTNLFYVTFCQFYKTKTLLPAVRNTHQDRISLLRQLVISREISLLNFTLVFQ